MTFKMDARLKLLLLAGLLALILSHKGFLFPLFVFALSGAFCCFMKIPFKRFLLRFSEPLFIVSVLIFVKSLSGKTEVTGLGVFNLFIYREGLFDGMKIAIRLLAAVGAVSVVSFSTSFSEILSGLGSLRAPKSLIEVSLFAGRFLKIFSEEGRNIYSAQKNRLGYSGVRRSLNSFGILAGSLTIKAFDQAQATSTAMLQRGYNGTMPALEYKKPRWREFLFAGMIFVFLLAAWIKLP